MGIKAHYGSGSITQASADRWRLRYRVSGKRFSTTIRGTKAAAIKELRRLLASSDAGAHVAPSRMTVAKWIEEWLALKGRSLKALMRERYETLLKSHVVPTLGAVSLQKLNAADVDRLYSALDLAATTMTLLHRTLKSCFAAAVKKKLIAGNPVDDAEKPAGELRPDEIILDDGELGRLVEAFKGSSLFELVAMAAASGMRRNEMLALRWPDIKFTTGIVTVQHSVEDSKAHGRRLATPKTKRSRCSFQLDSGMLSLLKGVKERQQRIVAGVPDGAGVDVSMIKLPAGALVFPSSGFKLTVMRNPSSVSTQFTEHAAKVGFPGLTLHDVRASHETALLDSGVSVHTVAARCGHDPATLLRHYARRTKKSDTNAAGVIGGILMGVLKGGLGQNWDPVDHRERPEMD
jgi:integrase